MAANKQEFFYITIYRFAPVCGVCNTEPDNLDICFKEHSCTTRTSESSESPPLLMALNFSSAVTKAFYSHAGG